MRIYSNECFRDAFLFFIESIYMKLQPSYRYCQAYSSNMIKDIFMIKINNKKVFGTAISTALMGTLIAAPMANAYGGSEDPNTGVVWGTNTDGTYMIPLASGGEIEGFCIDPGDAWPKQNGGAIYGEATPYGSGLNDAQKKMLIVSLLLGDAAANNASILNQFKSMIAPFVPQANNWTIDQIVAGASGVIHKVGDENTAEGGSGGAEWSQERVNRLQGASKQVYDVIIELAPMIPTNVLNAANVELTIRTPDKQGYQRMIAMNDIQLPSFDIAQLSGLLELIPDDIFEDITGGGGNPDEGELSEAPSTSPSDSTTPESTEPSVTTTDEITTKETSPVSETTNVTTNVTTEPSTTDPAPDEDTPVLKTTAGLDTENVAEVGSTITDHVEYQVVKPNTTYKLVAETADKETETLLGNTGTVEFTTGDNETSGTIDVPIEIQNVGSGSLVVFETLYEILEDGTENKVAEHRDINDMAQTVGKPSLTPEIRTNASLINSNVIQEGAIVSDNVSYTNLEPMKEYILEARLMDKATGEDTGALQEMTFTPETSAGEIEVGNIVVTRPDIATQVVFERLYDAETGMLVAAHEDINDAAQTVGAAEEVPILDENGNPVVVDSPEDIDQAEDESVGIVSSGGGMVVADGNVVKVAPKTAPPKVAPAPKAGGVGGGSGGAPAAPRQVIAAVPSGGISTYGSDIFNR